jgi:hypothetical protein
MPQASAWREGGEAAGSVRCVGHVTTAAGAIPPGGLLLLLQARQGATLSVYADTLVLFGGSDLTQAQVRCCVGGLTEGEEGGAGQRACSAPLTHNHASLRLPLPPLGWQAFNDVWVFEPTNPGSLSGVYSPADWQRLATFSTTGALPAGRAGHAAAVHADQLYVYGGSAADGSVLRDLWVLSLNTAVWAPVRRRGWGGL